MTTESRPHPRGRLLALYWFNKFVHEDLIVDSKVVLRLSYYSISLFATRPMCH